MIRVSRFLACGLLAALALAATAHGQAAPQPAAHTIVSPTTIQWAPGPPGLPPGAMMAVLSGDPGKDGLFVARAKLPDGYKVPPHWHPTDEHLTVLKGTLMFGMGEKFDKMALKPVGIGGFTTAAGKMPHYVMAKGETILQITAMGPFAITYVDPADTPPAKSKTN